MTMMTKKTPREALKSLRAAFRDLFESNEPDLERFIRLAIDVFDPDPEMIRMSCSSSLTERQRIVLECDGTSTIGHCTVTTDSGLSYSDAQPGEVNLGPRQQPIEQARAAVAVPPVDRTKRCLTDGSPVTDDHTEIQSSGMQKGYVVLTAEERAKGFVKPVRDTYRHKACGRTTSMSLPLAETYARDPGFYGGTFCAHCKTHFPLIEFNWLDGEEMHQGAAA